MPHISSDSVVSDLALFVKKIEDTVERTASQPQDWANLRLLCERQMAILNSKKQDLSLSTVPGTWPKCKIIYADILVHIRATLAENASGVDIGSAAQRIWSIEDLTVLNQTLQEIKMESSEESGPRAISVAKLDIEDERLPKKKKSSGTPDNGRDFNTSSSRFTLLADFLLDALAFVAMNDRANEVTEAYSDTFDWIFSNGEHGFAEWLQIDSKESIYWITGWAGSGKSTLMRYITISPTLEHNLRVWSRNTEVVTASFFFWESGTAVQRSQAGLLRTLLRQLLLRLPHLIPHVFSELWSEIWDGDARTRIRLTSSWPISRLDNAFRRFFEAKGDLKVCLLIDGLDEFEGDHNSMIKLLQYISRFPNTKVCVSSRPWDVFQRAFSNVPGLRVQDLTHNDMKRFVYGHLKADQQIAALLHYDPAYAKGMVSEIVERADGVFLWVTLAVRTLLRRPPDARRNLPQIRDFVLLLPRSLDELFKYLLFEAQARSSPTWSRILQLMRAREVVCDFTRDDDATTLTLWELALTDDAGADAALSGAIEPIARGEVVARCRQTDREVRESCAGLVEVHVNYAMKVVDFGSVTQRKVTYLHRTVKDFFADGGNWQRVVACNPTLDPHVCHLRAAVLKFRRHLGPQPPSRSTNVLWGTVVLAMTHARYASAASHEAVFDLLNAFDDTLNHHYPPRHGESVALDGWARACFGTYEERGFTPYPDPFLSLTTKFGVASYIEDYLDTYEYEYVEEKPLLSYAVEYLVHRQSTIYPLSSPTMVKILFKNGQNPNLVRRASPRGLNKHDGEDDEDEGDDSYKPPPKKIQPISTPWVIALEFVQQAHRRGWIKSYDVNPDGVPRWTSILKLFLEHGADPNVRVKMTYKDERESAVHLLTKLSNTYHSNDIEEVLFMLRDAVSNPPTPKN